MFVPSLSWYKDRIYIYVAKTDRFLTGVLRSSISIAKRSGCGLYLLQALV